MECSGVWRKCWGKKKKKSKGTCVEEKKEGKKEKKENTNEKKKKGNKGKKIKNKKLKLRNAIIIFSQ